MCICVLVKCQQLPELRVLFAITRPCYWMSYLSPLIAEYWWIMTALMQSFWLKLILAENLTSGNLAQNHLPQIKLCLQCHTLCQKDS